jgi:hypothetical protein
MVHREQVAVPGATVSLVHALRGGDCSSGASDKLRNQGHSAITDQSGLARIRVLSNSLVGGIFPIATIQSLWQHRHPPDQVTGREFFVCVSADSEMVSGKLVVQPGIRADLDDFEIEVMSVGLSILRQWAARLPIAIRSAEATEVTRPEGARS